MSNPTTFRRPSRRLAIGVGLCLGLLASAAVAAAQPAAATIAAPTPDALARVWDAEHVSGPLPQLQTHETVVAALRAAAAKTPDLFRLDEIGQSVEGRSINHLWFGRGPFQVLLWSQMHGDESTATAALFDLVEYVRRHRQEPAVAAMLDKLTIHLVPMLNPDGAQRFQRRNAQAIDINRDALLLQSPEGRTLKALRDRLNPSLGFNLHNQNWKTSAGKTGRPASISLLAVAMDEARTETPGRVLAKKTCSIIRDALEAFIPGQVARYDDEFEVRAFGDNITKWGTPVVLIETGPLGGPRPDQELVRLNFVAIASALTSLASGRTESADPARYESLPMNDERVLYMLIHGASIVTGGGAQPFLGDIGLAASRVVTNGEAGARQVQQGLRLDDLGDLRVFGAVENVDAAGAFVVPLSGLDPSVKEGATVKIPDWRAFKAPAPLAVPSPANLAILRPSGDGEYRVEKIIRALEVLGDTGPKT